jgi:hypothetical protein
VLTKGAGPGNMAAFARIIPILSKVEAGVVDSFRHGGGVFYAETTRRKPTEITRGL